MSEVGIDISKHRSKSVDEFTGQQFDYIITVCDNAKEPCPIFPSHGERIHHSFEDPAAESAEKQPEAFRRVCTELEDWLREFASEKRLID